MKTSEKLRAGKALIDTPAKWIKRVCALDKYGDIIDPRSDEAVCFCSIGAMVRIEPTILNTSPVFAYLGIAMEGMSIDTFNDSRTHVEVMEAFDKSIEAAEKDGD